jgi:hypothetical protein
MNERADTRKTHLPTCGTAGARLATAVSLMILLVLAASCSRPVEDNASGETQYDIRMMIAWSPGTYRVFENNVSGMLYMLHYPQGPASPILEIYMLPPDVYGPGATPRPSTDMRLETLRARGQLLDSITPGNSCDVGGDVFPFAFVFGDNADEIGVAYPFGDGMNGFNTHGYAYPGDADG